jgi:hypothetical protein
MDTVLKVITHSKKPYIGKCIFIPSGRLLSNNNIMENWFVGDIVEQHCLLNTISSIVYDNWIFCVVDKKNDFIFAFHEDSIYTFSGMDHFYGDQLLLCWLKNRILPIIYPTYDNTFKVLPVIVPDEYTNINKNILKIVRSIGDNKEVNFIPTCQLCNENGPLVDNDLFFGYDNEQEIFKIDGWLFYCDYTYLHYMVMGGFYENKHYIFHVYMPREYNDEDKHEVLLGWVMKYIFPIFGYHASGILTLKSI